MRSVLLASLLVGMVAAQGQPLLARQPLQPIEQLDQATWSNGIATFTGVPAVSGDIMQLFLAASVPTVKLLPV